MNNQEIEVVKYNKNITKTDYDSLKSLYEEAFPEDERIVGSMDDFINKVKSDKKFQLDLIYADPLEIGKNQLVAFSYSLNEEDYYYSIFIAIKKEFRGKGYGKKLIIYFKNNDAKNRHYFFLAEKLDDTAENKEQRIKRQLFYLKLGFKIVETDVEFNGVLFDFYSLKEITQEEIAHYLQKIQKAIMPNL